MGEYYDLVNVDKREFLEPGDFGDAIKYGQIQYRACKTLYALRELLSKEWRGDRIVYLGDEPDVKRNHPEKAPELFKTFLDQTEEHGGPRSVSYIYDMIIDLYRNVSCLFKGTEEVVREEVSYYLQDLEEESEYAINEYKIDPSDPFAGMFRREGKQDGYIVNYTKKICYALDVTRILSADGTVCDWVDPVSLLLCFGRTGGEGAWLGDRIGVEDDIPSGFVLLEELKLDR